jgi:hypothetical protein
MAIGKASDFKIYDDLVLGRMIERQTQNINAWNAASRGALRLTQARHQGNYNYTSFFKKVSLVSRRDITSVAAATDNPITQGENVSVKINRKIGPIAQTLDAFKKINIPTNDIGVVSEALGEQVADDMTADMLNTGLIATAAAIRNQAAVAIAATGANITTANLVSSLAKMGDRADRIVAWIMHSKPYYDLVAAQIAANITGVSNFNIATATPVTLNRPVIVTDSAALKIAGASPLLDTYVTLGITESGLVVEDSEEQNFWSQEVTGLENLSIRFQGEYAFNISVKGFTYDVANGGANPTDGTVGTGTNWDPVATSFKDYAGVSLITK